MGACEDVSGHEGRHGTCGSGGRCRRCRRTASTSSSPKKVGHLTRERHGRRIAGIAADRTAMAETIATGAALGAAMGDGDGDTRREEAIGDTIHSL